MRGIFLDCEANGTDFLKHHMLEIAYRIIDLETDTELVSYEAMIAHPKDVWESSNPRSLKVNGILFEELQMGKLPSLVKQEILAQFEKLAIHRENAVFICHNPSFDRGFFQKLMGVDTLEEIHAPYHWLDLASMFWVLKGHHKENFSLRKDHICDSLGIEKEVMPHKAMNGCNSLIDCYYALLGKSSQQITSATDAKVHKPSS